MTQSRFVPGLAVVTALVAALSLGPSFAHVLEALPRLTVWSPELWREATVFNGQFQLFATFGAPLDILAIVLPAALAFTLRDRSSRTLAGAAAIAYAGALGLWFALVQPANVVLATWTPGPLPADFAAVRDRWEYGHMCVAAAKVAGLIFLASALVAMRSFQGEDNG